MIDELFGEGWLARRLLTFIPVLLSLTVHEWAHAWAAWRLGDDTAARQGRLTLDPLAHIDPVGTIILPVLGVPFGWARPVPIDPSRFGAHERLGMMLSAAAGPASNLVLAALAGLGVLLAPALGLPAFALDLLQSTAWINVALAVFNLLPVPPLDGSRIADWLMPDALRPLWDRLQDLGPFALLLFLLFGWVVLSPLLLVLSVASSVP